MLGQKTAPVHLSREQAKTLLIVGGMLKRQVPEEVRGLATHVPQHTDVFSVPARTRHIVVVQDFVSHTQFDRARALCPRGARIHLVRGSKSAMRETLKTICGLWGGRQ